MIQVRQSRVLCAGASDGCLTCVEVTGVAITSSVLLTGTGEGCNEDVV